MVWSEIRHNGLQLEQACLAEQLQLNLDLTLVTEHYSHKDYRVERFGQKYDTMDSS